MKNEPAGKALVSKRIAKALRRAIARDALPKKPSAAELVRRAKLAGLGRSK